MAELWRADSGATISAVSRTLRTIEVLVDAPKGFSVAELAAQLQIEKSIASRLLASLAESGWAQRDPVTERYSLTLKLAAQAFRFVDRLEFPQVCQPILQQVADETGELVQLGVVEREQLVFIAKAEGSQRVRVVSLLGREVPLNASTGGKAWLASLPEEQAMALALQQGMVRLTSRTIVTIEALLEDLRQARVRGYAIVEGEFADGANGIGIALGQKRFGAVVGVLALSGPDFRFPRDRMDSLAPRLRQAAEELESVWPIHRHSTIASFPSAS